MRKGKLQLITTRWLYITWSWSSSQTKLRVPHDRFTLNYGLGWLKSDSKKKLKNFITPDPINSIRVWFRFDQKPSKDHKPLRSIDLNITHYHVLKWSLMVSETIIEVQFSFDYIIQIRKVHHRTLGFLMQWFPILKAPILQNSMQFSYYERVFSNGNWCHWLCCMNKNTLRMTFTVWRATYFETEVYMQVCIQNYILSPLFIRVKIDFNMTLTQSFDLIMWFLERISLMESRTVTNLSVMSH